MRAIGFQLRAELRVRWRSWLALAVLAGLLGGVLAATLACARRTESVVARYRRSSLAADVIVGNGGDFGNQGLDLARVRRLPQVAASHRGMLLDATVHSRSGADVSTWVKVEVNPGSRGDEAIDRPRLLAGRRPRADRPDEAVADRSALARLGVAPGERVRIRIQEGRLARPGPTAIIRIVGVRADLLSQGSITFVTVTPAFYRRYGGRQMALAAPRNAVKVRLRRGSRDVPAFQREVERLAQGRDFQFTPEDLEAAKLQSGFHLLAQTLRVVAALGAVALLLLLAQAIARTIELETRRHPVLIALGMTRTQLAQLMLARVALIGCAGALVAVPVTLALSPLTPVGRARDYEPHPGAAADLRAVATGVALALVVAAAPGLLAAARARRASPARAQAGGAAAADKLARAGLPPTCVAGIRMAGAGTRSATATPSRATMSVGIIAVAVAAATAMYSFRLVLLLVEVLLHGAADAARLRKHQFVFVEKVADVAKQDRKARARDGAYASKVKASALPSGRSTYRRLNDYTDEMKKLARDNPTLVKPITLPFKTFLGRTVQGIEITTNVTARDGKPVFLQMGVHHAREWPSGEHAMEWAYELVNGYKRRDARVRRLVGSVRTIVIPIVNPDGFNTSREAGQSLGFGGGRPGNDTTDTGYAASTPYEYQRKNCRINNPDGDDPARGDCTQLGQPNIGLSQFGVDPNRNYGGFWGGPGASADGPAPGGDYAQDYRGSGPFSEPETQNIRSLVSHRQVTTLITNHTFSNLVLRPPGIQVQGDPPDEGVYKALGDSMAKENAYTSQKSFQLYDTTGGTEDWTYYSTGGLGFTFEIGLNGFHPLFAETVAQYEGTSPEATAIKGKGNREAYFKAMESAADASKHSVLAARGPSGGVIRLRKTFKTSTSPVINAEGVEGKPILFNDALDSVMAVPDGGAFVWNVNPSTRPVVAKQRGRVPTGKPSPPQEFNGNAPPAVPCPQVEPVPQCYKDFPITVPTGAGIDNARVTAEVTWSTPVSDYDITIYRDTNGDGKSDGEPASASVGSSAQGTTNSESASFGEPAEVPAGKKYVLRVVNFAAGEPFNVRFSFGGPAPVVPAQKENWTLTCEVPEGRVVTRQQVFVTRGQRKNLNLSACIARSCIANASGRVRKTNVGNARLSRKRGTQRRVLKGRLVSRRGGFDRYCVRGGGAMRIGYPLKRLRAKLSRKERKRVFSRAMLILTTNGKYRIGGIRKGSTVRSMRRRFRGERRFKVGKNTWYIVRGSKARIVFKTRGTRVLEVGLADKRLTRTTRIAKRTIASWELQPKPKKKKRSKRR